MSGRLERKLRDLNRVSRLLGPGHAAEKTAWQKILLGDEPADDLADGDAGDPEPVSTEALEGEAAATLDGGLDALDAGVKATRDRYRVRRDEIERGLTDEGDEVPEDLRRLSTGLRRLGLDDLYAPGEAIAEGEAAPTAEEVVEAILAPMRRAAARRLQAWRSWVPRASYEVGRAREVLARAQEEVRQARRAQAVAEARLAQARQIHADTLIQQSAAEGLPRAHDADRDELLPVVRQAMAGTHPKWRYRNGEVMDAQGRRIVPLSCRYTDGRQPVARAGVGGR